MPGWWTMRNSSDSAAPAPEAQKAAATAVSRNAMLERSAIVWLPRMTISSAVWPNVTASTSATKRSAVLACEACGAAEVSLGFDGALRNGDGEALFAQPASDLYVCAPENLPSETDMRIGVPKETKV